MKSNTVWFVGRRPWIVAWPTFAMLSLVAVALVAEGILHSGSARSVRLFHTLLVFLALLSFALVVLVMEYFAKRELLSDTRLAHDRLRMAMMAGKSVAWDLDVKTGRDEWVGDLQSMFGIPAETFSGRSEDFYRRVHPEDQRRVAQAVADARENRKSYMAEFRVVWEDGTIRWVRATGNFLYSKKGDPERMLGTAVDITERRQADEALIKSEEKFSKAFRVSPMALILLRAHDHCYLDINETFERLTGWARDEVIGRTALQLDTWVDAGQRAEFVKQTLAQGATRSWDIRYRRKDGEERVCLGSAEVIEIEGETCILFAIMDITDRKKIEDELRRKEGELAEAQRLAELGSWQFDLKTRTTTWSDELYRIHGLDPALPVPLEQEMERLFTPESWQRVNAEMTTAAPVGTVRTLDLEAIRPDGSKRWVSVTSHPVFDATGEMISVRGTSQDITDRKLIEQQLHEKDLRLAGIIRSTMDAIIVVDEEQRVVLFNPAAEKMFGCPASEAVGSGLDRFIPQRFRSEHREHVRHFGETQVVSRERMMGTLNPLFGLRSNGEEFPIETSISQVQVSGRTLFTAIIRDVTERQRAEESLRESEGRFRLVANTAPVMIWMAGTDKLCNYFNQRWLDFTGRPLEAELGNGWAECVHPEDLDDCLKTYTRSFDRREFFRTEYRLRRHDGEYRWMLDSGVPRFNSDNSFAGYIGSCSDVTDLKIAEESLATMGRRLIEAHEEERTWIGRELHDDVNQRLALLAVELDRWNQERDYGPDVRAHIQRAQQRISEIAKDVQGLSHRLHSSKLEYLGLEAAANSFCRELSEENRVNVDFGHADVPSKLPKEISLCLFRVLQEALQNAVKHSKVQTFKAELRGELGGIELKVSDSGVGFDVQDAMNRRGLGLISMRERLQLVNGNFSVESKPGQGTTIYARVPLKAREYPKSKAG